MAEHTPLSGGLIARKKEAALDPVPSEQTAVVVAENDDPIAPRPQAPFRRSLTYRPTVEMHDWLRALSHRTGHSIQDLIDEALSRFKAGKR